MTNLHTRLQGKTILIFAARDPSAIAQLFQDHGATTIVGNELTEVMNAINISKLDGALLNAEANANDLFDIAEALGAQGIAYLFASHPDLLATLRYDGYCFPKDTAELQVIADALFPGMTIH